MYTSFNHFTAKNERLDNAAIMSVFRVFLIILQQKNERLHNAAIMSVFIVFLIILQQKNERLDNAAIMLVCTVAPFVQLSVNT